MTRVLVTGALGLLGGVLARRLAERGFAVRATGRAAGAPRTDFGAEYQGCDLADAAAVKGLFKTGVDVVVHAAARLRTGNGETASFVRDNILATTNLVDTAQAAGARLFVGFSSISVYTGDGPFSELSAAAATDGYGWSKRVADGLLQSSAEGAVVLRLAGLHGAPRRDGVVANFFAQALAGAPIHVAEPATRVTLTFVDDVVAAVEQLIARPAPPSRLYNLATAEAPSYRELAERVREVAGSRSEIASPATPPRRNRVLDTARIREELGFVPARLDEHLKRFLAALAPERT